MSRAHPRGGPGGPGPPIGTYAAVNFKDFVVVVKVRHLHLCSIAACVRTIFAMREDRASLQHGSGLTLA